VTEITPVVAAELFVVLLAVAAIVALIARRTPLPYSVALVLAGLALTAVVQRLEVPVDPDLLLFVLLPGLVFEAALQTNVADLRGGLRAVLLLAAPGVLVSAAIVALILHLATGLDPTLAFVAGAMVAATDPAAVIAVFKRLGAPRRLATVVEAESLFNDGTGILVFALALAAVQQGVDLGGAAASFVLTVVGSTVLGLAIGWVGTRVIAMVDDHLIELTVSLAVAYGTYLGANRLHESGIIATVVAGIVIGNYGRQVGMSRRTREALDTVWEFMAFLLTALTFLLVGLAITPQQLIGAAVPIFWGFVATLAGRAIVVYLLLGGAARILPGRSPLPLPWLHVLFWSGLRGAVATALALSLPSDLPQRDLLAGTVYGIVLLTLVLQGTTADLLLRRLGLGHAPAPPKGEVAEAA
jgi:CPA1 family monovalent cation:H+ antiporter